MKENIRLVIVDDSKLSRNHLISNLIDIENFQIVGEFANGQKALQFLNKNEVDIVIVDNIMRKINGDLLTIEIKKLNPTIKIIGMAIHEEVEYRNRFISCGANGFIFKECSKGIIEKVINSVF